MSKYFSNISVEPYVHHYEDSDGFQLSLSVRHIFDDCDIIESAKIRLVCADSNQTKDIWLETSKSINLKKGLVRLWLDCNVS